MKLFYIFLQTCSQIKIYLIVSSDCGFLRFSFVSMKFHRFVTAAKWQAKWRVIAHCRHFSQPKRVEIECARAIELPAHVKTIPLENNGVVYLLGVAHEWDKSRAHVAQVIESVKPNIVAIELGSDIKIEDCLAAKKSCEMCLATCLALKIPGCEVQYIDRTNYVTYCRLLRGLTWRGSRAAYSRLKDRYRLAMKALGAEYHELPASRVADMFFVLLPVTAERVVIKERDLILTKRLRELCNSTTNSPQKVVGVFGVAHIQGIIDNWSTIDCVDIDEITDVPPPTRLIYCMFAIYRICQLAIVACVAYVAFVKPFIEAYIN